MDITNIPTDLIFDIEEYHFVVGHVFYSPDLQDGLQIQSLSGPNLTVTVAPNGTRYLNDAEIIYSDYLINTGVLHVLAHDLSPNETGARPDFSSETNSTLPTDANIAPTASVSSTLASSLSTAAKAGIGVGAGVGALLVTGALYFCFRRSRSQKPKTRTVCVEGKTQRASEMPHPDNFYSHEMSEPTAGAQGGIDEYVSQRARQARVYEMQ